MLLAVLLAVGLVTWRTYAACLPDALPPTKNITVDGDVMPVGIWVADWNSSILASSVFRILAEEVLGYNVFFSPDYGIFGGTSSSAIWALAGCLPNEDCLRNNSTWAPARRYHIALEVYPFAAKLQDSWKKRRPERAPVRIQDIGYTAYTGTYVSPSAIAAGFDGAGISLKVYSSYNSSTHDPSSFFSKVHDIDASLLAPCNSSFVRASFVDLGGFKKYADTFPGDVDGYIVDAGGQHWPRCFNGTWWLSPACRETPHRCIPWITHGAWSATIHMQRFALYNMPIAVGFTDNRTSYTRMPRIYEVLMFWWTPDASFLDLGLEALVFPVNEHKALGETVAERRNTPQILDKWVSKGMQAKEPLQLAERLQIAPEDMDSMLRQVAAGQDAHTVACEWLAQGVVNPVWKEWIPEKTDCVEGQGWADDSHRPVRELHRATQCRWCALGFVSKFDDEASGYVCTPCEPGTFFTLQGQGSCQDCQVGMFSGMAGQTQCNLCEKGRYTSQQGSSACTNCPAGFTTADRGEATSSSCVCDKGMYPSTNNASTKTCRSCGWLHTTTSASPTSVDDCTVDVEEVKKAGLVLIAVACVCSAALVATLSRRYQRLQKDTLMHKTLKQGFSSILSPQHPMCVMPLTCFCNLTETELVSCHEGARNRGSLLMLDTAQDVRRFKESGGKV
eukprot:TRINITY_DN16481_c0_g3_i3.p1 TRINITY_DN16481_c0_g3~~TRINITY_DN16481_c0_g3_i3.p1  ORF type:complete len:675 (-),score=64.56 TRINITY_DN16481_c0_g3_i3:1268-3292(-)